MRTTIKGTYSNGHITLLEAPPTEETTEVLVTFTEVAQQHKSNSPRVAGFSKGTIIYMAPDFDAPLDELKDYM